MALEVVYASARKRTAVPNIVCIHGLGNEGDSTWHHEGTGKTWNKDGEFTEFFNRPCRVFNFTFNGAISANMSAAGILFHAHDLLTSLSSMITKNGCIGPLFFVAHSWGGIVLKKAVHLAWTNPNFKCVKDSLAGLFFLGTPHVYHDMSIILDAVSVTVALNRYEDDEIPEEDVRIFAMAVQQINEIFTKCRPDGVLVSSFWELRPTQLGSDARLIVSEDCKLAEIDEGFDGTMDCNHADLARFPTSADLRFRQFFMTLSRTMGTVMSKEDLPIFSWPPEQFSNQANHSRPASPPPTPPNETPKDPPFQPQPPYDPVKQSEERIAHWKKRTSAEETHKQRVSFLQSLKGWSELNTGSHLAVAHGTNAWIVEDKAFQYWRQDPECGTILIVGEAGLGKTHLAKGISNRLKASLPRDITMFFHCVPGEKPAIWEYFIWSLISQDPSWFEEIPVHCRNRDADSPPLSKAAFVEIWNAFRVSCSLQTIYMIVDGLEQCGDQEFADTLYSISQLRVPMVPGSRALAREDKRLPLTLLKMAFTCRPTPAAETARSRLTFTTISPDVLRDSISKYVQSRLPLPGSFKGAPSEKDLERFKVTVIKCANGYWPFAKFAVEYAQQAISRGDEVQLNASDQAPPNLQAWLRQQISEKLRQPGLDPVARQVVTLMAGVRLWRISSSTLADMSRVLCSEDEIYDVRASLLRDWGDFMREVAAEAPGIAFIHESIGHVFSSMIPEQQGRLNHTFIYINYLLLDHFALFADNYTRAMEAGDSHEILFEDFSEDYPFYGEAAQSLMHSLRRCGELGPQLEPFLRAFFDRECPQFWTWCAFISWKERRRSAFDDPIVLYFVQGGCVDILKHLLPPVQQEQKPQSRLSLIKATIGARPEDDSFLEAGNWPDISDAEGETALMKAAGIGLKIDEADMFNFVLKYGPNVHALSRSGKTALLTSFRSLARHGKELRFRAVEQLLSLGADVNACDSVTGNTPLCYAAALGDVKSVRLLLECGAHINVASTGATSPLNQALNHGHTRMFIELIERGADVDSPCSNGDLPLMMCMERDELGMFKAVLRVCDVNRKNTSGWAAVHMACRSRDRSEYLRLLLEHPAIDVDIFEDNLPGARLSAYPLNPPHGRLGQDSEHVIRMLAEGYPFNALGRATLRSNYEAVEMLLMAGADPGQLPGMKLSPVFLAARTNRVDLVRLLLDFGSPVNCCVPTHWPCTALGIAVRAQNVEMVELLLSHGADPTIEDAYGRPGPLYAGTVDAVEEANIQIIRMLLSARIPADVNASYEDIPPIVDAVGGNHIDLELVRLLLNNGADLTRWLEQDEAPSPLSIAALSGYLEICELLIEWEPDLMHAQFRAGSNAQTPLHDAAIEGETEVVRLMLSSGARGHLLSPVLKESPLLWACREGSTDCVKLLLEASPEMIHVPDGGDLLPLNEACDRGDLDTMRVLLAAGADFMRKDRLGDCFAPPEFFKVNPRPLKTIELLMEHGFDINSPVNIEGETILALAVLDGKARHVRWLLEQGADPLWCQAPYLEGGVYRNALILATDSEDEEVLELLLEPRRGLLEHLGHLDNLGRSVLSYGFAPRSKARKARIIQALEEHHAETGENILCTLLSTPDMYGWTPADRALGRVGISPSARPSVKKRLMDMIDAALALPEYRHNDHHHLIEFVASHLLEMREHDAAAVELLSNIATITRVGRGEEGRYEKPTAWQSCLICDDPITNIALTCRFCLRMKCMECIDTGRRLHGCEWVGVPLVKNEAFDLRNRFETLRKKLEAEDGDSLEDEDEAKTVPDPEETRLQSTLQLAILHAFNLLAFRRPLFTPYLDLAPSVQDLIAPWKEMIAGQRRFYEADNFFFERHWTRNTEEMRYLNRGLRRRYVDEEDMARMRVLEDVGALFEEVRPDDADDETSVSSG